MLGPFLLMGLDRMGDGVASRENKAEYSIKAKGRCFPLLYTVYSSVFLRPRLSVIGLQRS